MTAQGRTQANKKKRDLSIDLEIPIAQESFNRWKAEFRNAVAAGPPRARWHRLGEAGCSLEDLEWLLFNAIDSIDSAQDMIKQNAQFRRAKAKVLQSSKRLRDDFRQMTTVQFLGAPAWHSALALWTLKSIPPAMALLPELEKIERIVGRLHLLMVPSSYLKRAQSSHARGAEALVFLYVEVSTGSRFSEEIAELLETAADAYGLRECTFTSEALARRQRNYRHDHPRDYNERGQWIRHFCHLRRRNSKLRVDVFFVKATLESFSLVIQLLLKNSGETLQRNKGSVQDSRESA